MHHVIGTDDDGDIDRPDDGIDLIHFTKLLERDIGLDEKDVHVPGHAACDGMNGETNFRTVVFKGFREFFHDMLGLCDSHSVTGNEDDALGGFEDVEGVFGG